MDIGRLVICSFVNISFPWKNTVMDRSPVCIEICLYHKFLTKDCLEP